jgi:hypothetical protein
VSLLRRAHPSDDELSALLDGHVTAGARARIDDHLAWCAECRDAFAELRAVRSSLRAFPEVAVPRSFALRERDVRTAAGSWVFGVIQRSVPMATGVAMVAGVLFFALLAVDLSGGGSDGGGDAQTAFGGVSAELAADATGALDAAEQTRSEPPDEDNEQATAAAPLPQGVASDEVAATPPDAAYMVPDTARTPAERSAFGAPTETPAPLAEEPLAQGDDGTAALRIAQGALAALALSSGGLALFGWRRRAPR